MSEARFKNLSLLSPAGIYETDVTGKCRYTNKRWCEMAGLSPAEAIGNGWINGLHPDDRAAVAAAWTRMVEYAGHWGMEYRFQTRTGEVTWVYGMAAPLTDANGNITGYVGVNQDITERKRADEQLRGSEALLHSTINSLPGHLCVLDETGTIVMTNQAWDDFALANTADPPCVSEGVNYLAVCDAAAEPDLESARRCSSGIRAVLSGDREEFSMEYPSHSLTEKRWFLGKVSPLQRKDARWVVIYHENITERKQIEDAQAFLLQCGLPGTGVDFFESLARYLAETLVMEYVCIDRLEGDSLTAQTVAVYNDGQFESNARYALKDTPCGDVVNKSVCCYPQGVRALFPQDAALQELNAESYFGTTLLNAKGQIIGLIAIIGHRALDNPERVEAVLRLVAPRAAWEMERQWAEEALQVSEARYRSLFDQSLEGIFIHDWEGRILDVNEMACRQSGYSREEWQGLTMFDGHSSNSITNLPKDEIIRDWGQWAPGQRLTVEAEHQRKDGTVYPVEISTGSIRYGDIDAMMAIVKDITERKQAEAKLKEQLDELQRWHNATLSREGRVQELKREINRLLVEAGQLPRFASESEGDRP